MLRLILGRAGTGKTALLFSEIAARCARRQSGSFLIVPEQYSHEAERELDRFVQVYTQGVASRPATSRRALERRLNARAAWVRSNLQGEHS